MKGSETIKLLQGQLTRLSALPFYQKRFQAGRIKPDKAEFVEKLPEGPKVRDERY